MTNAQSVAASPDRIRYFGIAVGQDARAHPGKYVFYGAEAAVTLTPLPEAYAGYEGVKAGRVAQPSAGGVEHPSH